MVQRLALAILAVLAVFWVEASAADLKAGQLLVATPASRDPDFRETVVLLIHYDRRGAIGLMLNRPSKIPIRELLPESSGVKSYAWAGGPVPLGILGLLRTPEPPKSAIPLFGEVVLITDRGAVARLARDNPDQTRFRVYAGNCGWTMEQLDREVRRGLWTTREAEADVVFNVEPGKLWSTVRRR